ncbi:MAG: DNA glycosylase [Armatimonadota bacterium]|nr:DNA glycosylase [Armatimonadota bacterium]MDR7456796.1 DNA glycosylase [Armatimonadota bacterium]
MTAPAGPRTRTTQVVPASRFHLARTLQSGQCFRWTVAAAVASGGTAHTVARGVVNGTVARVAQRGGRLIVTWEGPPGDAARLRRHLGADQPLEAIEGELARDPVLRRVLAQTSGIAIMRQDPWECLVSYVISAFNNIPKICRSVEALARRFGEPIYARGARETASVQAGRPAGAHRGAAVPVGWSFPSPERLAQASEAALRACILGYRAPYVRVLARHVADGDVDLGAVPRLDFDDARAALLALPGVGEKVVECVLLFGFGRREAFPVDVWVQRAVERWYLGGRARTPRAIREWARERWGPLAGYAQQHLFAGVRTQDRLDGTS